MATIGEAVAALGVTAYPGEELVIVRIRDGVVQNRLLSDVADRDVAATDIYFASGAFAPGTIHARHGREQKNLVRVHTLPFDCDLADWDVVDSGTSLHDLPQDEIDAMIALFAEEVAEHFAAANLPVHALTYTGHGLLALVRVTDGRDIEAIREAHKAIIAGINKRAGWRVIDPAASDSGTRVYRLAGSINGKGIPRTVATLQTRDGALSVADLQHIATTLAPGTVRMALPMHARKLENQRAEAIVEAVRPYWTKGGRHTLALGFAGYLAKSGVPEDQAAAMMADASADDDEPWDRAKAVRSTYQRLKAGAVTSGFQILRQQLPASVVDFIDRELATLRTATGANGIIMHGTDRTAAKASSTTAQRVNPFVVDPLPDDVWFGWFGDYRNLVGDLTVSPDQFHLGASLTVAAALLGRRVRTRFGPDLFANLYTVLIGPSGSSKKDTAIGWATSLPQLVGADGSLRAPAYALSRDVSSSEGVVQMLKAEPNTLLYLTELSMLLSNARRKGTSTILARLIEAWDSPHVLENLNKYNPSRAENPYLSIIAATQPSRFANEVTDDDIASGFLNRWLIIPGVGKGRMDVPGELDPHAGWRLYDRLARTMLDYPPGTVLRMTDAAKAMMGTWYNALLDSVEHDEDESTMRQRHQTMAVKVALVYAASDGAAVIDTQHVQPAIALVEWTWRNVRVMMAEWAVGRDVVIENRVLQSLRKHGPMTRRQLQRACSSRKWSGQDFAKTLKAMLDNETVVYTPLLGMIGLPDED
jgi:hypothetical protein